LKLYHYLLLEYNPLIPLEILNKHQIELNGKTDKSFIDAVYKLMRDMFNYKPLINKEQFFSTGYVELKALLACELISLMQQKFKSYFTHYTVSSAHTHNSTAIMSTLASTNYQANATGLLRPMLATNVQRLNENNDLPVKKPIARTQSMNMNKVNYRKRSL
jgi:hypothetical protein